MKLRSYLVGFSLLLMSFVVSLLVLLSQRNLTFGFQKLIGQQRGNITGLLRSVIDQENKRLASYGRILRADNDLAASYILAVETGDQHLIKEKLNRLKEGVRFDMVDIISPAGQSVFAPLMFERAKLKQVLADRSGDNSLVTNVGGRLTLMSLSELELYGKSAGILVLGSYLDRDLAERVGLLTESRVGLLLAQRDASSDPPNSRSIVFESSFGQRIVADIEPTLNTSNNLMYNISRQGVGFGIFSIAVLSMAFCLLLELVFIRKFRNIVNQLNAYAANLENGTPGVLILGRHRVAEIDGLSTSVEQLSLRLIEYSSKVVNQSAMAAEVQQQAALTGMARQIAHDIRSPLTALNFAVQSSHSLPENVRLLIQRSAARIQDIANSLLQSGAEIGDHEEAHEDPILLTHLIEMIVSEKRMALQERLRVDVTTQFPEGSYGIFVDVDALEMGRILSNLIDNAIKAVGLTGSIEVRVSCDDGHAVITVRDNGIGIPDGLIDLLWFQGASFWPAEMGPGNGLGLHHARDRIRDWNGTIDLYSEMNEGTAVTIRLPRVDAPVWFAKEIICYSPSVAVILDDDPSIHRTWSNRFESLTSIDVRPEVVHLSNPEQLEGWLDSYGSANAVFLIDYEFLGQRVNGLDLIEKLRIEDRSILVTSRFEDRHVRNRAIALNVTMVPKNLAAQVAIVLMPGHQYS